MTEYFVQIVHSDKFISTESVWDSLKEAKRRFSDLCERNPKQKFKLVRRVLTDELVSESEDYRQVRFDFAQ